MSSKILLLVIFFISLKSFAHLCEQWKPSKSQKKLDEVMLSEASGLSKSFIFEDRYYHINDSGDGPHFYVTDALGQNMKKVKVNGQKFKDVEDLSVGACDKTNCIYIGDIGDNKKKRSHIKIFLVKEQNDFSESVRPFKILRLKYPDGPHDAEALAVHPNGDLFIFTKEYDFKKKESYPFSIYKLSKEKIESAKMARKVKRKIFKTPRETIELEFVKIIDLPTLMEKQNFMGQMVTAMDISKNGEKLVFLTYLNAIEVNMDLSKEESILPAKDWVLGEYYNVLKTVDLPQQEALSFSFDGKSFVYNTEYHESEGDVFLYKLTCQKKSE